DGNGSAERAARAERASGGGTGRTTAIAGGAELPIQRAGGRAAHRSKRIREHWGEVRDGRNARAAGGRRAGGIGRGELRNDSAIQRGRRGGHGDYAIAGSERAGCRQSGQERARAAVKEFSARNQGGNRI